MFSFDINNEYYENTLVIFSGQLEGDDLYYGNRINDILKTNNKKYKDVIFVIPSFIECDINKFIQSESSSLINNIKRINNSNICFYKFDKYANLEPFYLVENSYQDLNKFRNNLIRSGMLSLVENKKDRIILTAPPGTVFLKPSGEKYNEFIKSSEIAVGHSEVQFVAFSLLSFRPNIDIRTIFIDTAGISHLVESIASYIEKFGDARPKYKSFQSYGNGENEGFKTHRPDVLDDIWVIISASTSNNLGKRIFKDWSGLKNNQIVTLLSYKDASIFEKGLPYEAGDSIVLNISCLSEKFKNDLKHGSEIPVKIVGESFTAQIKDPNKVVLKKIHRPKAVCDLVEKLIGYDAFILNRIKKKKVYPVFFDYAVFLNKKNKINKDLVEWIRDLQSWFIPSEVYGVIYDKDCNETTKFIKKNFKGLRYIDLKDLKNEAKLERGKSVIVFSPVISNGTLFEKVNSDLRYLSHEGQRIFISPFVIGTSTKKFEQIEKSVTQSKKLKYQFHTFKKIFIGHDVIHDSWDRELNLLKSMDTILWGDRITALENDKGLINNIGLTKNGQPLKFNVEFAFWDRKYNAQKENFHPAVYVTVASILQGLREKTFNRHDEDALFNNVYQNAVLDPSNFSRFNDPLLQSILWRCAKDSELDYSSLELSKDFLQIFENELLVRKDNDLGLTLDLLLAIAIKKIKLNSESVKEFLNKAKSVLADEVMALNLIGEIEALYGISTVEAIQDDTPF